MEGGWGGGKRKRRRALDKTADDINYKDINYGGNVYHYNNTKHMRASAFDHKPYKTLPYLLRVINTRPTVLLY